MAGKEFPSPEGATRRSGRLLGAGWVVPRLRHYSIHCKRDTVKNNPLKARKVACDIVSSFGIQIEFQGHKQLQAAYVLPYYTLQFGLVK